MAQDYITPFVYLLEEMAPYLLLGFLIAGLLHAFVPQGLYRKWLSGNDLKSVLLSIAFGVPLPLCSCGVIPTAVGMRKDGASKGATTAFLIATPQTGVDSIAATWSVLGLPFAILRPVAALVTGFVGGMATSRLDPDSAPQEMTCMTEEKKLNFWEKCIEALKYGFVQMPQDIGRWLVLGLILAGLITIFVPDDFFASHLDSMALSYLLILAVSVPMYVCATGSIPVAAALILKGLSPGAALVFLMAGPATNIASMLVLGKTLGRKSLIIYLVSIIAGAVLFGLGVDFLLPREWFTGVVGGAFHSSCCHVVTPSWKIVSTIVLCGIITYAIFSRLKQSKITPAMMTFKVTGMMCNHCKANVESHVRDLEGVEKVEVTLVGGILSVEGTVSPEKVIETVKSLGYDCELAK